MRKAGATLACLVITVSAFIALGYFETSDRPSPDGQDVETTASATPQQAPPRDSGPMGRDPDGVRVESTLASIAPAEPPPVIDRESNRSEYIDPETDPGRGFPGPPRHTGQYLDPEGVDPPFVSTLPERHVGMYQDPEGEDVVYGAANRVPVHRGEYRDPEDTGFVGNNFQHKHVGQYADPDAI